MSRPKKRVPTLSRHKATGRARCHWRGKDYYFGQYGTAEADRAFRKFVAEVMSGEEVDAAPPPACEVRPAARRPPAGPDDPLTVSGLLLRFKEWAEGYYIDSDGKPTQTVDNLRLSLRLWRERYGPTPVADFGPVRLSELRDAMIAVGLARKTINARIGAVNRAVKWGVSRELVDPAVLAKLQTLEPLKKGRSGAKETAPVRPAPDEHLEAALPYLRGPVAAMARLQRYSGARPGEICGLTPREIDRSNPEDWRYVPAKHKTAHRNKIRVVCFGPRCRAVLAPILAAHEAKGRGEDDPLFQPRDATAEMLAAKRAARKTPDSCGNRPGTNRKASPKRKPGTKYSTGSYRQAIQRACEKATVDRWSPNRLRHTAATEVQAKFGLSTARDVLGHGSTSTTEIYAHAAAEIAARVAADIG
ncbi:tyrosine-type recombinase/integrase [Alienimonas sp. DA493]|uniref:tyrosine-type recombinase/integrase n=1 Tax=Alienimonas sp. DA493 TaxID=3373605 RepID=UPI00375540C4